MTFEELQAEMQKALKEFREYAEREGKEKAATGVVAQETKDALDRLNKRIDELQAKMERPVTTPEPEDKTKGNPEYRKAFGQFARKGIESPVLRSAGDNLNVDQNDSDGGYAVPVELDRAIYSLLLNQSPIRGICNVISVSNDNYEKLVNLHGSTSGWVGEIAARNVTKTPQFEKLTPYMGEWYAFPQTTQKMLDDAMFDVEAFLAGEIADLRASDEGTAFVSGNGTNQPKGFLSYTLATTADGVRAFKTIQYTKSGKSSDFADSNPVDAITDLIYTLKAGFRQNARFVTNKAVLAKMRKFKDGNGNYLWMNSVQAGQPSSFLGYPVTEAEDMPALGSASKSLAFGDFKRGYTICDRMGTRVLRDPYTNKPYVGFYTTARTGGFVMDSEAIKLLSFEA